jgi:hypothetical protein
MSANFITPAWHGNPTGQIVPDVVGGGREVGRSRRHSGVTNRSEDILGVFTAALDNLDIPWTRSTRYVVSIYRKAAAACLDEFIGPKR